MGNQINVMTVERLAYLDVRYIGLISLNYIKEILVTGLDYAYHVIKNMIWKGLGMSNEKIFYPEEIQESPFPGQEAPAYGVSNSGSGGVSSPNEIKNNTVPSKRVAVELLSTMLNTKSKKVLGEFQLVDSGGFRIGKYVPGVSGEVVHTPEGITAKSKNGLITFALIAEDGSAVFAGEVQAGSLISGAVRVGDGDIVIDGETKRMLFYADDGLPSILIGNN